MSYSETECSELSQLSTEYSHPSVQSLLSKAKMLERVTTETPHFIKQLNTSCSEDPGLSPSLLAAVDDLGQTLPQVDLTWFETNLLPPLPAGLDLNKAVDRLKNSRIIDNDCWAVYKADPKDMHVSEDDAFAHLVTLIENIVDSASEGLEGTKQLLQYRSMPSVDMVTVYDDKPSGPDGYFVTLPAEETDKQPAAYLWHQIGVSGEYKLRETDKDLLNNRIKITWNLYQQLREDPRRRFALAYSIENTTMRLWFANRSEVLVSTPFNFVTNHQSFVGFIMRIAFAEEHQIGWDTTMELLPVPDGTKITELMYDITVHDKSGPVVYRTKKLLSDVGARAIRGSGTRVWEAVKLDENKTESKQRVALKDSWVDANRRREADILESVKKADDSDDYKEIVKDYLLTVDSYGDVLIGLEPDHSRNLHANCQKTPAKCTPIALVDIALHAERRHTQCSTNKISHRPQKQRTTKQTVLGGSGNNIDSHDKQHHRVVFEEVGSSLYEQTSLVQVFKSLILVTSALDYIHQAGAGWVHRDISPGNILVFPREDGATPVRLADFEYAKEITDHTSREVRIGTVNFIAAEADIRRYRFEGLIDTEVKGPVAKKAKLADAAGYRMKKTEIIMNLRHITTEGTEQGAQGAAQPASSWKPSSAVFFHNAVHDLESIWWIAVWFLVTKEVKSSSITLETPFDTSKQRHLADKLFYGRAARLWSMTESADFYNAIQCLHPSVYNVMLRLVAIKTSLVKFYKAAEKNPQSIGKDVASGLYELMMDHLGEAAKELLRKRVVVGKFTWPIAKEPVDARATDAVTEAVPEAASSRKRKFHD